jgi:preprotein translocase subunit SecF
VNLLGKKKIWYLIASGIVILIGIIFLAVFGLRPGIDFAGGSLIEIKAKTDDFSAEKIKKAVSNMGIKEISIYRVGERGWILKMKEIDEDKKQEIVNTIASGVGKMEEKRFETVGPTISSDLRRKAILAVSLAVIAIILYIALAFRKLPKFLSPWKFGLSAIAALVHDIVIILGSFAIFGHFLGYEVDSLFITALLTILGYSVHDSIVIFDRIRENFKANSPLAGEPIEKVANYSLVQTLARSLNTSITIVLVMLAMLLLGGKTLQPFILALLIGVISGTYSSIFLATPILVMWHKR